MLERAGAGVTNRAVRVDVIFLAPILPNFDAAEGVTHRLLVLLG